MPTRIDMPVGIPNYLSQFQPQSPYTSQPFGPALSATQGFMNSYIQMQNMQAKNALAQNQYYRSLLDIQKSQSELGFNRLKMGLLSGMTPEEQRGAIFPRQQGQQDRGLTPSQITQIRKEAEEGMFYDTPEEFSAMYNPENDPFKAQQLQTFWDLGHKEKEEEPSWWEKLGKIDISPVTDWTPMGVASRLTKRLFAEPNETEEMETESSEEIKKLNLKPGAPLSFGRTTGEPSMIFTGGQPQRALGEPVSIEEFERQVAELKRVDIKAAKTYYDKWASKWQ